MIVRHDHHVWRPEYVDDGEFRRAVQRLDATRFELAESVDDVCRVRHRARHDLAHVAGGAIAIKSCAAIGDELVLVEHGALPKLGRRMPVYGFRNPTVL